MPEHAPEDGTAATQLSAWRQQTCGCDAPVASTHTSTQSETQLHQQAAPGPGESNPSAGPRHRACDIDAEGA